MIAIDESKKLISRGAMFPCSQLTAKSGVPTPVVEVFIFSPLLLLSATSKVFAILQI